MNPLVRPVNVRDEVGVVCDPLAPLYFLDTLIHAYDDLTANQCFATGGFGPDEQLLPRAAWRKKTDFTHNSFETQCGAFAVFKLCKYLMTITGDARYGDWIERLVFNALAATIPMSADGRVFYYSDYCALGGSKRNHTVGWSCCTGTRPMALADLHDLIYFHSTDGLHVNLFVPSTLDWNGPDGRLTIRQRTHFPEDDSTELVMTIRRPVTFNLKLRSPGWLAGRLAVDVNGQPAAAPVDAHGWAVVRRLWRNGDRVVIHLPMKFDIKPLDTSAPLPAAIMRGPVALAVRAADKNPGVLLRAGDLERALIPSDGEPLYYHARSDASLLVRPFYALKEGEPYFLYLDPNRYSHRSAQFTGGDWRESEAFRYYDRPGASVEFAFEGTGVRWIGYRFDDAGLAEVKIDGQSVAKVEQYAPRRDQPFEWRKDGLNRGSHRLTLTILDTKPEQSKGRFINVAGFEVIP